MKETIEKEYKVLLTKDQYKLIEKQFSWDYIVEQTNYYYDTPDFKLRDKGITVRIREKEKQYKLQIKYPNINISSLYMQRKELEMEIDSIQEKVVIPRLVNGPEDIEVQLLGTLKTYRHTKEYSDKTIVCLDRNEYIGTSDYELEIEFVCIDSAKRILESLECEARKCESKYDRWLKAYLK